jgi:ribosome modulation factor
MQYTTSARKEPEKYTGCVGFSSTGADMSNGFNDDATRIVRGSRLARSFSTTTWELGLTGSQREHMPYQQYNTHDHPLTAVHAGCSALTRRGSLRRSDPPF